MAGYVVQRLALALATVLAATFLTYVLLRLVPGEPAQVILTRVFLQDQTAAVSQQDLAAIADRFGLVALIASGYRALSWVFLAVYVLPLLTMGLFRLLRGRAVVENQELQPAVEGNAQ